MQLSGESSDIVEEFPMMPGTRKQELECRTREQGIPWLLVFDQRNSCITKVDLSGP